MKWFTPKDGGVDTASPHSNHVEHLPDEHSHHEEDRKGTKGDAQRDRECDSLSRQQKGKNTGNTPEKEEYL